ncbi:MAG: TIGR03759 family integrating conjugative element protein, partial [bacterium]|nr:TIGR03759 family integrating conjugative element protein [bacterium]
MSKLKFPALIITLLATQQIHAELNIPGISTQYLNTLKAQDQTLARAGLTVNTDDLTSEQDVNKIQLNEQQLHEAKVWELTL